MVSVSRWAQVFLTQFIAAADLVHAVTLFGDDAFEPDLANMGKHRAPVDLKTLAKLDVGAGERAPAPRCSGRAWRSAASSRRRSRGY